MNDHDPPHRGAIAANRACPDRGSLPVFVSILPQKFFVEQIGGDLVEVRVMVMPGASPATYEPKPQQMVDLARAKLYFSIGVPFENAWLDRFAATSSALKVVHTDAGIKKLSMPAYHHLDLDEGAGLRQEKHLHGHHKDKDELRHDSRRPQLGLDPHIWTSPALVKIQARSILAALAQTDPENSAAYQANWKTFTAKIDKLDRDLHSMFAGREGMRFMVFHPAWGYFAHDYKLKQIPIEIEGKNPKPAQLQELIHHAEEQGIRVIFVQPQFSSKSATLIAEAIGGKAVPLNPLAEDWLANMRKTAETFKAVIK